LNKLYYDVKKKEKKVASIKIKLLKWWRQLNH